MSDKVPQYSSVTLSFENVAYNTDPAEIDLSTLDDIILSIATSANAAVPILKILYSSQPSRFAIDNVNKKIDVYILGSDGITDSLGKYLMNLWLEKNGELMTHFMESFTVVKSVPPT
jgi:hypothetical protein